LRCFHLLRQLARFHEVHAIVFQREAELRRGANGYSVPPEVRLYSPVDIPAGRTWFDGLPPRWGPALHYRWLRRSCAGPANRVLLSCRHLIRHVLESTGADIVVFEELDAMKAAPLVRRLAPGARLVVNLYNVNHRLVAAQRPDLSQPHAVRRRWRTRCRRLERLESSLDRHVDAFLACSEVDRRLLCDRNTLPGYVVPNGVDTQHFRFDPNPRKREQPLLLYSGSMSTEANQDGARFFAEDIWPAIRTAHPGVKVQVVGRGMPDGLRERLSGIDRVEVTGEVPDVRSYCTQAAVSVVPLRIGSGTRLKILEGMSQGLPIVSTPLGAEGIEVANGEHLLIAEEPQAFANAVGRLLSDAALYTRIQQAGRKRVEERYDWDVVGNMLNAVIERTLEGPGS